MRAALFATIAGTFLFAAWLGVVDGWAQAVTVVVLPTAALLLAALAFAFRTRARLMVARVTAGRTGRVDPSGVIRFDDGQLPIRAPVRNRRVTPGPAVALEARIAPTLAARSDDATGPQRVVPGLRGEVLAQWRDRLRRWTNVAVASFVLGATPLLASLLLDVMG